MSKSKIRIEIIPDDDVDATTLRDNIHTLINVNRKGCKSIRSWIEELKTCESTHQSLENNLLVDHKCILTECHKEKHKCICGFSWDVITTT